MSNLPAVGVSARTMSWATDGFSAITNVFIFITFNGYKLRHLQCRLTRTHARLLN
jgi:hypothetical protein